MEQYHIVSVKSPNFRGRKKQPGRLIYDPSTQHLGVFLGYCTCHNKIITDQRTITYIAKNYRKSQKSLTVRILLAAAKRIEAK